MWVFFIEEIMIDQVHQIMILKDSLNLITSNFKYNI